MSPLPYGRSTNISSKRMTLTPFTSEVISASLPMSLARFDSCCTCSSEMPFSLASSTITIHVGRSERSMALSWFSTASKPFLEQKIADRWSGDDSFGLTITALSESGDSRVESRMSPRSDRPRCMRRSAIQEGRIAIRWIVFESGPSPATDRMFSISVVDRSFKLSLEIYELLMRIRKLHMSGMWLTGWPNRVTLCCVAVSSTLDTTLTLPLGLVGS